MSDDLLCQRASAPVKIASIEEHELPTVIEQEKRSEDVIIPYQADFAFCPMGQIGRFENEISSNPQHPLSQSLKVNQVEPAKKEESHSWNPFTYLTTFWNWLTGASPADAPPPEAPPLTEAQKEEIRKIFDEASKIATNHLKNGEEEEVEEVMTLTMALVDVYKEIYAQRDLATRVQGHLYRTQIEVVGEKRKELLKKRDELQKALENRSFWQKAVGSAGGISLAFVGAVSLSGLWTVAAVAAGSFVAMEQFSGGKCREAVAKSMAKDDTIKQQTIEYYLGLATNVLCFAGTIIASQGTDAVRMAAALTQVPVLIGDGVAERKADLARSCENEVKHEKMKSDKKLGKEGTKVNKIEEAFSDKMTKMIRMLNHECDSTVAIFRE